jgi:hypothetical protein
LIRLSVAEATGFDPDIESPRSRSGVGQRESDDELSRKQEDLIRRVSACLPDLFEPAAKIGGLLRARHHARHTFDDHIPIIFEGM